MTSIVSARIEARRSAKHRAVSSVGRGLCGVLGRSLAALCLTAGLALSGGMATSGCAASGRSLLPAPEAEYAIGPDDQLDITVWKEEGLSRTGLAVRRDGKITLPLIGELQAEGRTPTQLAKEIRERLAPLVKEPTVQVNVKESNSARFFVVGEVARPGMFRLQGTLTPVQAIAMAGGLTEFARKGSITLIRRTSAGEARVSVDFDDLVRGRGRLYTLAPGDTVYVP
jgi:polysaccharide export outer membrane protein